MADETDYAAMVQRLHEIGGDPWAGLDLRGGMPEALANRRLPLEQFRQSTNVDDRRGEPLQYDWEASRGLWAMQNPMQPAPPTNPYNASVDRFISQLGTENTPEAPTPGATGDPFERNLEQLWLKHFGSEGGGWLRHFQGR